MPVLKVISYQIQQLFVNLIGNALKYSKHGISPEISIDCEKLEVGNYPIFIKDTHKKYYKISIPDNGMGFDQQFSEKIFILFSRLHQKADFPGSGIGLSICKKLQKTIMVLLLQKANLASGLLLVFFFRRNTVGDKNFTYGYFSLQK